MTTCKKYRDLILQDLYGELSSGEARLLKMHLDSCERCAEEYKKTAAALEMMDKRKRPDPGKEYWDNYWHHLHQRISSEGVIPTEPSPWKKVIGDFRSARALDRVQHSGQDQNHGDQEPDIRATAAHGRTAVARFVPGWFLRRQRYFSFS